MAPEIRFQSLKGTDTFKKMLSSQKFNSNFFTIYFDKRNEKNKNNDIAISFVSAKKLGTAVKRNRIKRRLKMAALKAIRELNNFNKSYQYAVFAKSKVYDANFENLVEEFKNKLGLINNVKKN
ncbi:MAG: ribonuclease P protein component [Pelagibacterales bacterium]|nr:ribonuclease P protein component [Pelagibacterales bacterium]